MRRSHVVWQLLVLIALVGCAEQISKEPPKAAPAKSSSSDGDVAEGQKEPKVVDSAAKRKRLIFLTNTNSPFWDAARAGLQDAEKELQLADANLTAVFEVNNGTPEGQIDKLKQYGSQSDVAGVALSVVRADNVAIADEMKKLRDKGIAVVTVDSDIDAEKFPAARSAFIGTNNIAGGKVLGRCALGIRADGGEYVAFFGIKGAQNVIERTGGFADGAGETFAAKDLVADDGDPARARDNVRTAIRNHAGLNMLVGIWSYNAPAIVDVVRELERRKDFAIVVFDAEPLAIAAMGKGDIDAMVVQNPYAMGFESIRLLKSLAAKDDAAVQAMFPQWGEAGGDVFDTGLKVVVPNADSPLTKDLFPENVEFLPLDEFKAWLEKYGLSGS